MGQLSIFNKKGTLLHTLKHVKKGKSMWSFIQDDVPVEVSYDSAVFEEYLPEAKKLEAEKLSHLNLFFHDEQIALDVTGHYFNGGGHSSPSLTIQNDTDPGVWRFDFMGNTTSHIYYIKKPLS